MKDYIRERVIETGAYMIETESTIRQTAEYLGVSKSTVHLDIHKRMPEVCKDTYCKVCEVLEYNKAERHLRGGMSTKLKYARGNH